ncbi:MSMEG_4193 family putative phosphomutase [Nitriliruptor alkaliphilus]|uniref:MSMEG_4193 family putative phosphomutase n=1 Tax=Nitriliruptor alkaliphilus TaxID=427918 RepID=UPI0009F9625A|nr:MSMEG_4193 family putative phosphomutase [Nitriliruptor alkaliphilus]
MATIVLLRHATTAATGKRLGGWTPGVQLDEAGVAQAEAAAQRLAQLPVKAVYASPLERTQETAKHVAKAHDLKVRTRRDVGEVDYGEWTDRPLGQLRRRSLWPVIQATPSRVTFPGGESIRGAQARAVDAVEALASDHRGETIVVVSHADVIKAVLAHFLGMPLDTFQRLQIAPASVSVLHLAEGGPPVVSRINDHGPLTAPPAREPEKRATKRTAPPTSGATRRTTRKRTS